MIAKRRNRDFGQTPPLVERPDLRLGRLFAVAALLTLAGLAALAVDVPVARWSARGWPLGDLRRVLIWSECFGHGVGVVLIVLGVYWLDPARRARLPRVLAVSLGAGIAADAVKMLVARTRPRAFDLGEPVLHSFTGWFRLGLGGSDHQAFPSAHVAVAVGFALALAWLYPKARWMLAILAVLVACQRIEGRAHFLSDTLTGAALGFAAAAVLLPGGCCAWGLDWWEDRRLRTAGLLTRAERDPSERDETPCPATASRSRVA